MAAPIAKGDTAHARRYSRPFGRKYAPFIEWRRLSLKAIRRTLGAIRVHSDVNTRRDSLCESYKERVTEFLFEALRRG